MSRFSPPQAVSFLLVGTAAAAVHFAILLLLVDYYGLPPLWANVWAFAAAFCISFTGHFRLTFRHQRNRWFNSLRRWLCGSIGAFLLNQALFAAAIGLLGERYYTAIWLAVTLLITVLTFLLGKFWAFRTPKQQP